MENDNDTLKKQIFTLLKTVNSNPSKFLDYTMRSIMNNRSGGAMFSIPEATPSDYIIISYPTVGYIQNCYKLVYSIKQYKSDKRNKPAIIKSKDDNAYAETFCNLSDCYVYLRLIKYDDDYNMRTTSIEAPWDFIINKCKVSGAIISMVK